MSRVSGLGISGRLLLLVLLIGAAIGGVALYARAQLNTVWHLAQHAESNRSPQMREIATVELNVTRASLQLRHAMLSRTPEQRRAAIDDIGAKKRDIDEALERYAGRLEDEASRRLFVSTRESAGRFWEVAGANLALVEQGRTDEAFDFLVDRTIPVRNELLATLSKLVDDQTQGLGEDIDEIKSNASDTLTVLLVLCTLLMVALAGFAWWLRRTLHERIDVSRQVAQRVRDGDLATPVKDTARDEFSPLLQALAEMQAGLVGVVQGVRQGAQGVATASDQIAQGNQDLSSRTEQQASALQQTAATMEELGTTVQHNAAHAQEADRLAGDAAAVATRGGTLMADVVATMRDISGASSRIAEIIGVIDGLAFQTNILALNAAVEAARAGEQGRGFAVVASEVRSLAQRSAEASREVRSLIVTSGEQVERGSGLVEDAGRTMDDIVTSIGRVTRIVGEIAQASQAQSQGVGQVGAAMQQMDQATQQNAALVEESAAAAQSMRQQARDLVDAVAAFRTGR